jgi:hypothetical protein
MTALYVCPHTTIYLSSYDYMCVRIPLHMCPYTAMYIYSSAICVRIPLYVSSYCHIKMLLAAEDSATCVSAYHYIFVLILIYMQD